jgi:hypothetical protein
MEVREGGFFEGCWQGWGFGEVEGGGEKRIWRGRVKTEREGHHAER